MSQPTINAQAISRANELATWATQLRMLLDQSRTLLTAITDGNLQTVWNAMATYTAGADGSQPASNDATPNNAHPITGLNLSANELQGLAYMLADYQTFMTSTTTSPPQQNRESTIVTALL